MKKVFFTLAIAFGALSFVSAQTPVASGPAILVDKEVHDYGDIPFSGDGTCEFKVTCPPSTCKPLLNVGVCS